MREQSTAHDSPPAASEPGSALDLDLSQHPVLSRLVDEVRNAQVEAPGAYNRTHNRHNRSR